MARGRGRPTKLTDELADQLVGSFRIGASVRIAAWSAGVHPSTVKAWLARGEAAKTGRYREFHDRVEKARADRGKHDLAVVEKATRQAVVGVPVTRDDREAAKISWNRLRTFDSTDYATEQRISVQGGDPAKPVQVEHSGDVRLRAADPEAAALAHQLLDRLAGGDSVEPAAPGGGTD